MTLFISGTVSTASAYPNPASVDLGTAGNFAVLSKAGISTTGTTAIVGDIGVSPIAASAITGFALVLDSSGTYAISSRVTGKVYAANYASPTPSYMTTAIGDMQTAYTNAAGRASNANNLYGGNLGGRTLTAGVYKWTTGVTIPTDVTLSGSATDVWIFQIAGTLNIASGKKVILSGGALPSNIYWVVADKTALGTYSVFNGNILDKTAIVLRTGATLNGRALAQTAVTLDTNIVNHPTTDTPLPPIPKPLITVTYPNGYESLNRGQTYSITWSSIGNTGDNVKIELLNGGDLIRVISSNALNNGAFSWTVPVNLATSRNYKIRVTSKTNSKLKDVSNNGFKIVN